MKIRNRIWNKLISLIPFLIAIPILIMLGLYFINKKNNKVEDIDVAKGLIKDIKIMRVAIDEYYQKTGTFPDLALNNEENEIEKSNISFIDLENVKSLVKKMNSNSKSYEYILCEK